MPIEWVLMADMVLMTVRGTDGPPSLSEAAAQLHIPVQDIDAAYGVVPLGQDLYAVQIDPSTSRPSAKAPSHIAGRFPIPGSNRSARCKPHLKLISRNASLHATASRIVDDAAEGWAGRAPSR